MFWIALELNNPKMGLIIKLSLKITKSTAFKSNGVMKFGNIRSELLTRRAVSRCTLVSIRASGRTRVSIAPVISPIGPTTTST